MGEMNENWDDWLTKAKKRFADLKYVVSNSLRITSTHMHVWYVCKLQKI